MIVDLRIRLLGSKMLLDAPGAKRPLSYPIYDSDKRLSQKLVYTALSEATRDYRFPFVDMIRISVPSFGWRSFLAHGENPILSRLKQRARNMPAIVLEVPEVEEKNPWARRKKNAG